MLMSQFDFLAGTTLHSGLLIESIDYEDELFDVIGRPATGWTRQIGHRLKITLLRGLSADEASVTIYHELIEGAMGVHFPDGVPVALHEVNEAQIDALAVEYHQRLGPVTVETLNEMLQDLGF
jgi:hypothetical protein